MAPWRGPEEHAAHPEEEGEAEEGEGEVAEPLEEGGGHGDMLQVLQSPRFRL